MISYPYNVMEGLILDKVCLRRKHSKDQLLEHDKAIFWIGFLSSPNALVEFSNFYNWGRISSAIRIVEDLLRADGLSPNNNFVCKA